MIRIFRAGNLASGLAMRPTKFWIVVMGLKLAVFMIVACREQKLPAVPMLSPQDVQQAIFESIKYENGFLLIQDTLLETLLVVPADIPWMVKCGFGFTVAFGRGAEAATEVQISSRLVSHELCRELAPMVARVVATIAAGKRLDPADLKP